MILTEELNDSILSILKRTFGNAGSFKVLDSVYGGSINRCFKVEFGKERLFLKINSSEDFSGMFMSEAEGLKRLAKTSSLKVPNVIGVGASATEQFLITEWIEQGKSSEQSQADLGSGLAELHKNHAALFGLDHDNYMGSLKQANSYRSTFSEFFIENRIKPQVRIAVQKQLLSKKLEESFEILCSKLPDITEEERPSFVHGDLWSGNYIISQSGEPYLIDPATAYSNREVDIAMTDLFGGFDRVFYQCYHENFPLSPGWQDRIKIWNLYPLLIHLNIFGRSYLSEIITCVNRFT